MQVDPAIKENPFFLVKSIEAGQYDFGHFHNQESLSAFPDEVNSIVSRVLEHVQLEDHQRALHLVEEALNLYQKANVEKGEGDVYYIMGIIYERRSKFELAIKYLKQSLDIFSTEQHELELGYTQKKLGDIYAQLDQHHLALQYYEEALQTLRHQQEVSIGHLYLEIGKAYRALGRLDQASYHFTQLLDLDRSAHEAHLYADAHHQLGAIHMELGTYDSALYYLELAFNQTVESGNLTQLKFISENLIDFHEQQLEPEKALVYHKVLSNTNEQLQSQQMALLEKQLKNDHAFAVERLQYQNLLKQTRQRLSLSLLGLVLAGLLIFNLIRNYQKKRRSLVLLKEKNEEILRTRQQMITQEKMASLGQLTAGIAHEIKNPINFVNNFAEGSIDLVEELAEELKEMEQDIQYTDQDHLWDIINSIKQNSSDIIRNGKRADQIVSSMLDYARDGRNSFQSIDIHPLIEEQLYLVLQASNLNDYALNVTLQKNFDPAIDRVEVMPQDLARVFLNLITNALYALKEKSKNNSFFGPVLEISTSATDQEVIVSIKDNGTGIPPENRKKVFTPFYTSKPPNSGNTGLGLSISYEIVVARHHGSLELESETGQFTELIMRLPFVQEQTPTDQKFMHASL
ncbi:MAG: tetratricopeptide repeat protein [Saprospiraceae bacterium]|nr:tetratricopeptide repeat protein [Saprospiraceae bacterium]